MNGCNSKSSSDHGVFYLFWFAAVLIFVGVVLIPPRRRAEIAQPAPHEKTAREPGAAPLGEVDGG